MPKLFDIGGTLKSALKGAVTGAKESAAQKILESKELQKAATKAIEKQAATSIGEKAYSFYQKNKWPLIIGVPVIGIGILWLALRGLRRR